jgi:hypothetical protein
LIKQLPSLTNEQADLRTVATLVAVEAPPEELFAAVTEEVGNLLVVDIAIMHRFGTANAESRGRTGGISHPCRRVPPR